MSSKKNQTSKRIMAMVYGIGAAIVIVGALFKLMHWPGGGVMLTAGLLTEAIIFFISAFEKPEKDLDWALVYPQLNDEYAQFEEDGREEYYEQDRDDPVSAKLDELFKAAHIDGEMLKGLSGSLQNLTKTASSISGAIEVGNYNQTYAQEITNATESVRTLNNFYQSQIEVNDLQGKYNQEVLDMTGKVKNEMESLATNLSSLNSVYGNMITAMKA